MIQLIIYIVLVIALFIYTFMKMVKDNNSNYVYILALEFVGIIIDFILILASKVPNIVLLIFMYIISVIIPIAFFVLEKKQIHIDELINIYRARNDKEALKNNLLKNIEKYPESFLSHKKLAKYYEENKEFDKAEDEYLISINIKPKDYETYIDLAQVFKENKKEDEAINLLQGLLEEKPDYLNASLLLGSIYYDTEHFKEAILVYNEAIRYNPAQFDLYYSLGMTYTRLNDFQNAKEYYEKAAKINSYNDVLKLNLGQIYLIFREYDEAEKYFFEAIDSEDEKVSANSYLYLAKINLIKNEIEKAVVYANMAIEIDPKIIRKIENDETFAVILGKIKSMPEKQVKSKISEKEEIIIEHLGKTYNVVEKLTDDMKIENIERER